MKKKRIKWGNVGYLLVLLASSSVIIHDFYKLALEPIFTGYLTSLTIFGLITLGISFYLAGVSYDRLFK